MLVSVLEEEWFVQLVSDSGSGSGRARRVVFREEAVAALATACAQVRENETQKHTQERKGERGGGAWTVCIRAGQMYERRRESGE